MICPVGTMARRTHMNDRPQPRRGPDRWVSRVGIVVLAAAHLALGIISARVTGVTEDEHAHVMPGYAILKWGDYRFDPTHPPLAWMWFSWPLLLQDVEPPDLQPVHLPMFNSAMVSRQWICQGNPTNRLLFWPRVLNVLLGAALAVVVWAWLRRRNPYGALLAAGIVALSPNLLAHDSVTTTDAAAALAFALAVLTFLSCMRCVTPLRLTAAAGAMLLAATVKFSSLLALPACVLIAAVHVASATPIVVRGMGLRWVLTDRTRKLIAAASVLGLVCAFTYVGIWAAYGFRYSAGPADTTLLRDDVLGPHLGGEFWWADEKNRSGLYGPLRKINELRLLPETYTFGLFHLLCRAPPRQTFLFGDYWIGGRWYFFPVVMLIKMPLPALSAVLAGVIYGVALWTKRRRGRWRFRSHALAAGLATAVFLGMAMRGEMNIGVRHVLPIFPMLAIVAGATLGPRLGRSSAGRLAIAGVLVWQAACIARIHPDYLCHINEIAVGPEFAYNVVADSNLDWGQDVPKLADYCRDHPDERIVLGYFGADLPSAYGIRAEQMPFRRLDPGLKTAPPDPPPGTYIVSATYLQGLYTGLGREWTNELQRPYLSLARMKQAQGRLPPSAAGKYAMLCYHRILVGLRARQPRSRIGYTMLVYDVDEEFLRRVLDPRRHPGGV